MVLPSNSENMMIIDLCRIETPLGAMIACAVAQGICLLEFSDRKKLETELNTLSKILNAEIIEGDNIHFDLLKKELKAYFEGKRKIFSVPLFTPGSAFQQLVWNGLQNIPYGSCISYKQQSNTLGKPNAIRAVANANGMNRILILIPCHRVIGENGNLTGYSGGLWRKKWLIDFEKETKQLKLIL
jgi:AraC family transcriptional regulator of adaptative response/methylated-DNA-[protein]-cysteine methyltransferase